MPRCGYKPHAYTACTRELGHEGPCCHALDPAVGADPSQVCVDLRSVALDFDSTEEELDELYWKTFEAMFGKRGRA
jgi:hypothetical protein